MLTALVHCCLDFFFDRFLSDFYRNLNSVHRNRLTHRCGPFFRVRITSTCEASVCLLVIHTLAPWLRGAKAKTQEFYNVTCGGNSLLFGLQSSKPNSLIQVYLISPDISVIRALFLLLVRNTLQRKGPLRGYHLSGEIKQDKRAFRFDKLVNLQERNASLAQLGVEIFLMSSSLPNVTTGKSFVKIKRLLYFQLSNLFQSQCSLNLYSLVRPPVATWAQGAHHKVVEGFSPPGRISESISFLCLLEVMAGHAAMVAPFITANLSAVWVDGCADLSGPCFSLAVRTFSLCLLQLIILTSSYSPSDVG